MPAASNCRKPPDTIHDSPHGPLAQLVRGGRAGRLRPATVRPRGTVTTSHRRQHDPHRDDRCRQRGFRTQPAGRYPRPGSAARLRHRAARHRSRAAGYCRADGKSRRGTAWCRRLDHRARRSPRRAGGRRLRHQHGADRHARGDAARLRHPAPLRPEADHRRHRRHLPWPAHHSVHAGHGARYARGVPGRAAAELHQPDEHADLGGLRRVPRAARGRAVPQRAVHRARWGSISAWRRSACRTTAPASTT
jgi:hypothetical protein